MMIRNFDSGVVCAARCYLKRQMNELRMQKLACLMRLDEDGMSFGEFV